MNKKNPFLTKKALSASSNKRLSKSTPEKDISKVQLANEAINILKKVKANFRRASAIDAVRKMRKTYHLGGLKRTAEFMNQLAELPSSKVKEIKKSVEDKPNKETKTNTLKDIPKDDTGHSRNIDTQKGNKNSKKSGTPKKPTLSMK